MIQVDPAHYNWRSYNLLGRWVSYWHQIDEVLALGPADCLEIGVGTGLVTDQLRRFGVQVTTVDFDARLPADRVGDIRSLPCAADEFDVVLCSQVLEHIPWSDVPTALAELNRVCRRAAVVSLPQSGISLRLMAGLENLTVKWGTKLQVPHAGSMPDEHYWQVGRRGTHRSRVRTAMAHAGFEITKEYTLPDFTYHRFYVLSQQSAANGAS